MENECCFNYADIPSFEFHVGDYVETIDGNIGYISGISETNMYNISTCAITFTNINTNINANANANENANENATAIYFTDSSHKNYWGNLKFKRIGKYEINKSNETKNETKNETNNESKNETKNEIKIKLIPLKVKTEAKKATKITFSNGTVTYEPETIQNIITGVEDVNNFDVVSKINEIIDYINKN